MFDGCRLFFEISSLKLRLAGLTQTRQGAGKFCDWMSFTESWPRALQWPPEEGHPRLWPAESPQSNWAKFLGNCLLSDWESEWEKENTVSPDSPVRSCAASASSVSFLLETKGSRGTTPVCYPASRDNKVTNWGKLKVFLLLILSPLFSVWSSPLCLTQTCSTCRHSLPPSLSSFSTELRLTPLHLKPPVCLFLCVITLCVAFLTQCVNTIKAKEASEELTMRKNWTNEGKED